MCKARGTFMLPDSLSPQFILSPRAPSCTHCTLAISKPAGFLGQNPRGRKMNVKPQVYQGSEAKGSPSRQPAPSPAPSTENTHHSKPRSSLAGVAGHRSRVGPEKQVMKFLVISMGSSKPSPDAPNIPARHHCRSFQSWFLLQLKA